MKRRAQSHQNERSLRLSFAALLLGQFLALSVFAAELIHVFLVHEVQIAALVVVTIRIICCLGVACATLALYQKNEKGWRWGVALQLSLIAASLVQVSLANLEPSPAVLLTISSVFFQIVSLRMFFLRSLVVRYGLSRLKSWFRERRVGARAHCKIGLVGQTIDEYAIDCQLINVSLSGCLFCTSSHLEENQVISLSPEHTPDMVLKVVVKSANHRKIPISPDIALLLRRCSKDANQAVQFYAGSFEEKLSDEEFNRILRGKNQPDQPQQSA